MVEYKVACPQCHSALKSAKPIPAGMKLKCPRCGTLFSAPHAATNGPHNGALAATAVSAAIAVQTASPVAATVSPAALTAAPPARPVGIQAGPPPAIPTLAPAPVGPPSKAKLLALVAGGGVLLVGTAILLIMLCFSGGTPPAPTVADSDDPPLILKMPKKPAPPPPLVSLPPEEQKKADACVAKAVEFLKRRQMPNGTWGNFHPLGMTAMGGLTLLEGNVKADDPHVQKVAQYVRKVAPTYPPPQHATYELSLAILFLDRLNDPQDKELIQRMTLRLVAAQLPSGGWTYTCPLLTPEEHNQLYTALRDLKTKTPEHVAGGLASHGNISPRVRNLAVLNPAAKGNLRGRFLGGDNSNTQFAILALLAARKHDVPLDRSLALLNKRFHTTQNPNGSWGYAGPQPINPMPTMTCAGLLGIAVGFGIDDGSKHVGRPEDDSAVKKALEHLSQFVGNPGPPGSKPPMPQMYYLWSVERVAVLYQLKTIKGKEWYPWGAQMLLANQQADGSWRGAPSPGGGFDVLDTCFGILFLQRANLAQELTDKLEELRAAQPMAAQAPPGKN